MGVVIFLRSASAAAVNAAPTVATPTVATASLIILHSADTSVGKCNLIRSCYYYCAVCYT
jgi:hypothetical protein